MHLKRIIVPNFRVLKDVDISFEPDLVPRIFPLGSINGGGKSTLLQLIFTLLHCSGKYERIPYLQNMLDGFEVDNDSGCQDLASIELIVDKQIIELDFFICNHHYIINEINVVNSNKEIIKLESDAKIFNLINLHNSLGDSFEFIFKIKKRIESLIDSVKKKEIKEKTSGLNDIFETFFNGFNNVNISEIEINLIERFIPDKKIRALSSELNKLKLDSVESKNIAIELLGNILNAIHRCESDLLENKQKNLKFQTASNKENLLDNTTLFVCYYNTSKRDQELFLMCNVKNLAPNNILSKLTDQVFLAAPVTQVFHFLEPADKLLLFRADEDGDTYHSKIDEAKSSLEGFFPYDFLAVDILVKAFTDARDEDFKQAISTGEYGSRYQEIIADLAKILGDKKANPELDLDGVNFIKIDEFGKKIQLYPADLSHGELKRLSLYVWLKYNKINDAIILMDEVEIALHPDWQYGIINDLQTWAPNNQYILATHSYELCQALTPAHVKEIEPKLLKHKK
jgi:ABC-type dipeptide/oligopeptide/nickel transport system ATPase component